MGNDWDNMPPRYYEHLAECREQDAAGVARKAINTCKNIVGWAHKELAVAVRHCYLAPVIAAHKVLVRGKKKAMKRNSAQMKQYRQSVATCEYCGKVPPTETHHVTPLSMGGLDEKGNYMAVCLGCHRVLHPDLPGILFERRALCIG